MLALRYLLLTAAVVAFVAAAVIVLYDLYLLADYRRRLLRKTPEEPEIPKPGPPRFAGASKVAALGVVPLLVGLGIVVVPSGMAGVRVSQISGTRPGTLYPGVHFVKPLVEYVALFDIRDKVFSTAIDEEIKKKEEAKKPEVAKKPEMLKVQAREGLSIGMGVTVRYRLDPRRLDYIQRSLPQPVDSELVAPTIASVFRELTPNYTVREIFAAKREEVRAKAADEITRKLDGDGIVVKEVMLRDIQLPPEYARGLENLLLKEQENDQLSVQTDIQQKQVRISELQAEAQKVADVKQAEGAARVRVLQAKGEADAMQYTLPLKQKQIEQTRLESEARKEATIKGAEAAAQAKVIDSKAELERRNLLAQAEANRIRVTAAADAERMKAEAVVLKENPLLINKIVAERLSDKVQIMMVPTDGRFFFNDVLRNAIPTPPTQRVPDGYDDPPPQRMSGLRGH
ncbi:MAG: SPFH domain-containing protein [Terriglobales bacterium]